MIHVLSFNDTYLVAKDSLKLNNTINTYLIRLNIFLYDFLSLSIHDCSICQIYQWNGNRLKHTSLDSVALHSLDIRSRQN